MKWSRILNWIDGQSKDSLPNSFDPSRICTDTRNIKEGDYFIPLKGPSFDGHNFIPYALEKGARLALCENAQAPKYSHLEHIVTVKETLKAYQNLAQNWRKAMQIPVIAITGSSGKTSTKEILAQVMAPFYHVLKTEANYNNEIGVPKTLLQLTDQHQLAILEMGMRGLGQIQELCEIGLPDMGIITHIGSAHIGELGSQENVAQAKWELAEYLSKTGGTLIAPSSDAWCLKLAEQQSDLKIIWCGQREEDTIQLLKRTTQQGYESLDYRIGQQVYHLDLHLPGSHQVDNLLLALGALYHLGHRLPDPCSIKVPRLFGRSEEIELKGIHFYNDAYNANPDSMRAALKTFCEQSKAPRYAVLGTMGELGENSQLSHMALGHYCRELPLDGLFVSGKEAKPIALGAQDAAFKTLYFETRQELTEAMSKLPEQSSVLLKASRSAAFEKILDTFKA